MLTHCPEGERFVEQEVCEYNVPLAAAPRLVLDLGAHVGAYTDLIHARWPEARVVACEPMPENAALYRANFDGPQFVLLEAAARSFEGRASIRRGLNGTTHSFHELGSQNGEFIEVRCLDAQTLPAADLIKIDTEGCEWEILQRLDLSEARAIVVEYHRAQDATEILRYLRYKGFYVHEKIVHSASEGVFQFVKVLSDRLFVGVPMYASPNPFFAQSVISVMSAPPCDIVYRQTVGDSPVGRSRNMLSEEFLRSDCSHLLFIDCDLIFSREQLLRILRHKEPIVGGLYPKKQPKIEWVLNTLPDGPPVREDGLLEVNYIGTGFIRIAREVFEKMLEKYGPDIRYVSDQDHGRTEHNFWPIGLYDYPDGSRRYLSEDWFFCQRAHDVGYKVYADCRVVLKHCGNAIYPLGNPFEPAIGPGPTADPSKEG